MAVRLNTKILLGFIIALSVLVLTSFTAYFIIARLSKSTRLVEHSYQVLQRTGHVRLGVLDAQSAVCNYPLRRDTSYLRPYDTGTRQLLANVRLLDSLVADQPEQQANVDTLRRLVTEQLRKLPAGHTWHAAQPNDQALDTSFKALENRNRELDQFAYVASHDLKAPLRGLGTIVQWMEEELPATELSPQLRTYLGQLKGRIARLEDLINGLLAYARATRSERFIEPTDTAELLRGVADLVVPPSVALHLAPDLPTFTTDRLALEQVFTNLLSNAVKYGQPATGPAQITISARDLGEQFEFRVQDNGPGIAPAYHQKIFLLFQNLRDRHTAESTGSSTTLATSGETPRDRHTAESTGIGLSIAQKVVDDQQGSVWGESEPGQGAAFVFIWPKQTDARP